MRIRLAALVAALGFSALALPIAYKPAVGVTVGTSAAACASSASHVYVKLWNEDASKKVYVAFDSSLTTASGIPVYPNSWIEFTGLARGQILYCVTTSTTADVRVQEGYDQ